MIKVVAILIGLLFAIFAAASRPRVQQYDAMSGTWEGSAEIFVNWTTQRTLSVRIDIQPDGAVAGKIGDATLRDARLSPNRNKVERWLDIKADYIVKGGLDGEIIAAEHILRDGFNMPLNWTGEVFKGSIHTTGLKAGDKDHMILTAGRLELRRVRERTAATAPARGH